MARNSKAAEGNRVVRLIRKGMADAEVKNLTELADASGMNYKTLCRRMKDGCQFTVGELYLLSRVIPLKEVEA